VLRRYSTFDFSGIFQCKEVRLFRSVVSGAAEFGSKNGSNSGRVRSGLQQRGNASGHSNGLAGHLSRRLRSSENPSQMGAAVGVSNKGMDAAPPDSQCLG
jgi:hypothetical protein